jgi:hypothetical protein
VARTTLPGCGANSESRTSADWRDNAPKATMSHANGLQFAPGAERLGYLGRRGGRR